MKPLNKNGFTIVETMLFLGISGMLIIAVLAGTGTSINIQRYRDSVTSLKSFLQQQYSEVSNASNDSTKILCNSAKKQPRGQSECVILGKYITTMDKETMSVKSVIGTIPLVSGVSNDIDALKQYKIQILPQAEETYTVDWGSSLNKTDGSEESFSILILRSPSSGVIRTFIENDKVVLPSNIKNMLVPTTLSNDVMVCVNSNGLFTGAKLAVYIGKNATSASGIEIRGEGNGCR